MVNSCYVFMEQSFTSVLLYGYEFYDFHGYFFRMYMVVCVNFGDNKKL